MQNQGNQPPPGYPTDQSPSTEKQKKKLGMKCWPASKPKGERGFLEGCLFALCCCWLCEACF